MSCVKEKRKNKKGKYEIPFSIIHGNAWGPSCVTSYSGFRWLISFIDGYIHITRIYLLKEKFEVAVIFKSFHTISQNQFHTKIQVFWTYNGREYFNNVLILPNKMEWHRKNRHLLEVSRALQFTPNVPKICWNYAVFTAAYLINNMPFKALNSKTHVHVLKALFPNVNLFMSRVPSS